MINNPLDPLPLKSVAKAQKKVPFPYRDFSTRQPEKISELSGANRLEQLKTMLAEKHAFDANLERETYDKAYLSGEKAGLALGQKRAEQILEKMQRLQEQTQLQLDEIKNTMCEAMIDISGILAEWLVGNITADERMRLLDMVKKAAQILPDTGGMVMVVHPDDFSQFEKLLIESDFQPHLLTDNSVRPSCMRIANEAEDILIDPCVSIVEAVAQLKKDLLPGGDSVVCST
jgi:flagellar biosynthesis/type III secretory pathway protein FliH